MAENEQGAQPTEGAQGAPNGAEGAEPEKDWKAEYERLLRHSRTWEDKAKRLKEKADRYDELAAKSMTDAERAEQAAKRADEAEAELAKYRLADERRGWAQKVSKKTGVPVEVLAAMDADSEEALELAAEPLKGYFERSAAPVVPTAGVQPPEPHPGKTANEWLRETIPDSIKRSI